MTKLAELAYNFRTDFIARMGLNSGHEPPRQVGLVREALPGLAFRVVLDYNQSEVLAYLGGRLKMNRIRVLPGDKVIVEVSPDGRRGRIVRRL